MDLATVVPSICQTENLLSDVLHVYLEVISKIFLDGGKRFTLFLMINNYSVSSY